MNLNSFVVISINCEIVLYTIFFLYLKYIFFILIIFWSIHIYFWNRVLGRWGWPLNSLSLKSASPAFMNQVLRLYLCTTVPGFLLLFILTNNIQLFNAFQILFLYHVSDTVKACLVKNNAEDIPINHCYRKGRPSRDLWL